MIWTKLAQQAIAKVPPFVQPMLKMKVEEEAVRQKVSEITPDFIKKIQNTMARQREQHMAEKKSRKLESFFANTDDEPIYAGFKNTVSVHAGLSGKPVDDNRQIWSDIASRNENSPKRALYIHIPFCVARCKFCSFYKSRTRAEELDKYAGYILKELEMVAKSQFARSQPFDAVYFGGGTPTDMSADSIRSILTHLQTHWDLSSECEITFEGRLHGFTDEKVTACMENGVNRFSFGVQSFNTKIRQQMGRIDPRDVVLKRLSEISSTKPGTVSVDLIYGLPDQTPTLWLEDINTALETPGINSCSIYNLKFLPGSPIHSMIDKGKISVPASLKEQADLYRLTSQTFHAQNVIRSGLRHWSFGKKDRSVYNYIPKYGYSCLPIGSGAGGKIGGYSVFQARNIKDYYKALDENEKPIEMGLRVDKNSAFAGQLVGQLEEYLEVNLKEVANAYQFTDLLERYQPLLSQWQNAGMIDFESSTGLLKLTEAGAFHNVNLAQNLIEFNAWSQNEKK